MTRIQIGQLMERLRALEHPEQAADAERQRELLAQARETLLQANAAGVLSDEMEDRVQALADIHCRRADGAVIPLLTPHELESISIRQGTLTADERREIQRHVVYTQRLLGKMKFSGVYQSVPVWASAHHELLDGSGYPAHLDADQLPMQVRLLTILDIFDALTAEDRPYKPAMPLAKAFAVLESMRDEGKLDGRILALFKKSEAWKKQ